MLKKKHEIKTCKLVRTHDRMQNNINVVTEKENLSLLII